MYIFSYIYVKFMSAAHTLGHVFGLVISQNCFKELKGRVWEGLTKWTVKSVKIIYSGTCGERGLEVTTYNGKGNRDEG